jgi:hypothetical protein
MSDITARERVVALLRSHTLEAGSSRDNDKWEAVIIAAEKAARRAALEESMDIARVVIGKPVHDPSDATIGWVEAGEEIERRIRALISKEAGE